MPTAPVVVMPCYINGLATVRSLGRRGVKVVAANPSEGNFLGRASRYAHSAEIYPDPRYHPEEFLGYLLDRSRQWRGAILVPTRDEEAEALSRHKRLLEEHFIVPVCELRTTEILLEKYKTYALCEELGIPCPRTRHVTPGQGEPADLGAFDLPCIVKPVRNCEFYERYGRRKALVAHSLAELREQLARVTGDGFDVMVQELIPGRDDTLHEYVSYWSAEGRLLSEFTCRKLRQNPPGLGVGRVRVSTYNAEVIDLSRRLLEAVRGIGFLETEYKHDARDGKYKLLEVNPRSVIEMQHPIDCGVDMPWIMYSDLAGGGRIPSPRWREGVYWIHGGGELRSLVRDFRKERDEHWTLGQYVRPYLGPRSWAILDARDMGPFFWDLFGRAWAALRRHRPGQGNGQIE